MAIQYALVENHLTSDSEDYYARVQKVETIDRNGLIKQMTLPGALTETHVRAVLTEYHFRISQLLEMGYAVNDGLVRYKPGISGRFLTEEDTFNDERHEKTVNLTATKKLKDSVRMMEITRVKPQFMKGEVFSFTDLITKEKDTSFTPAKMARIKGRDLLFDYEDNEQGIFFVSTDGTETRSTEYGIIKPSSIVFNVPPGLAAGDYTLEVRSKKEDQSKIKKAPFRKILHSIGA